MNSVNENLISRQHGKIGAGWVPRASALVAAHDARELFCLPTDIGS